MILGQRPHNVVETLLGENLLEVSTCIGRDFGRPHPSGNSLAKKRYCTSIVQRVTHRHGYGHTYSCVHGHVLVGLVDSGLRVWEAYRTYPEVSGTGMDVCVAELTGVPCIVQRAYRPHGCSWRGYKTCCTRTPGIVTHGSYITHRSSGHGYESLIQNFQKFRVRV